ncbi:MAG: Gfo/Idh/MocA family oxidoreductase [Deltaproteobacteria bacterium]
MVRSKLRLGVIGLGRHGSRYARHAALDVDSIELVAVCQRDQSAGQEVADSYGCRYTGDARALATATDIDALVLVTLPHLLPNLVTLAARSGKRLLIEKPVAPDLASGRAMLADIQAAGVYCMAAQTLRFNSVCLAMKDLVPALGRIDSLVLSQRFPPQPELLWLDDPIRSGGGNILHTGVHCFDLIRFLTGLEPESAFCTAQRQFTSQTEDNFTAILTFGQSKALAMVTCSRSAACYNGLIEISGENGQLVGDHVLGTLYLLSGNGRKDITPQAPVFTVLAALERFAADAANGCKSPIAFADGLAAVAVADACYRSASSRIPQPVARLL